MRTVDVEIDLRMFGSDPLCLPDGHVTDQLTDVLHVVNVLGEQVALHLEAVGFRGEPSSWEQLSNNLLITLGKIS